MFITPRSGSTRPSVPAIPGWKARLLAIASIALWLGACTGLPKGGNGPPSSAMKNVGGTALAASVRPRVAAHPGLSGLHPLMEAQDALAARLALADVAERSLDVQYFIWNNDMTGKVLLDRLFSAADRGVRVRLLLDDLGTMPTDDVLLTIDSHPNIEVRMFNPVAMRSLRKLGMAADFARINKRMHNKSFTADGQIAIVGGRNIGDEYFGAHAGVNFADLDVVVIGPVVNEVSDAFDLYWNHRASIPMASLSNRGTTPGQFDEKRAALRAHRKVASQSQYADIMRRSEFVGQLKRRSLPYVWGPATIVNDHPDKVLTSATDTETHLAPQLREVVDKTKRELFLVSPYFVPGKEGVALLANVRQRGPRVVVITNSLASTDSALVHSGYQRYRKDLIRAGVELCEIKPTAASVRKRSGGGLFGSKGAGASSGASLHAKTFAFDRQIGFIGSYNLDPRSSRLNTEMGVLFDCPALAKRLPEEADRTLATTTFRVELEGDRLVWVTREGDQEVRYTSEPNASKGKRSMSWLLSLLPIEGLL
ncbi:MAG: phospholipase D family protein [Verrucomicrobiales bacterium]